VLHLVNKSPFQKDSLTSCLRLAQAGSSILLIEDGVYAALRTHDYAEMIAERMESYSFYLLGPDAAARGLPEERIIEGVKIIDYAGFVDLVIEHDASQSWL